MNLLIITPLCPFPPDRNGGAHTLYNLIKANDEHNIDLIYYGEPDSEAEFGISEYVDSIRHIDIKRRSGGIARVISLLLGKPFALYQYAPTEFAIPAWCDTIIYDQFSSELFVQAECDAKQICFVHDSMPLYFERKANVATDLFVKIYYKLQSYYSCKFEKTVLSFADRLVFVSEHDSEYSANLYGCAEKCKSIKLGVDQGESKKPLDLGRAIVFSGVMDYAPNEDAALYFVSEVYPEVKKRFADVKLYLVGRNPSERLNEAARNAKDVVVTGYVDSVFPYIMGATVYVSPLRFGAGVKNKVLEAMRCGAPSIFSPVSIESIPEVAPGENCLVARSTEEWIEKTTFLLGSDKLRQAFRRRLAKSVIDQRTWGSAFCHLLS